MNRWTVIRLVTVLLVAVVLVLRSGLGGRWGAPVHVARGSAGLSSGEGEVHAAARAGEPADVPLTSLPGTLLDQDGRARTLAELRGTPFIASLVYTRCPSVCPRLVAELKALQHDLPVGWLPRFVLVSLDPAHDDPPALRAFAAAHALDRVHWTLLTPGATALPAIARALGVAWSDDPGGGISHSAVIAVVDSSGRIRDRLVGLDVDGAALAAAWRQAATARYHRSD
jgi:protein SCO1/2